MAMQLEQVQLSFLRHHLAGQGGELPGPRVKLFVMGANQWRDEDEWPLARTRWTPWYFQPGGGLDPALPGAGTAYSRYRHDPADPVPTVGGATLMTGGAGGGISWLPGPRDQRAVSARPDVLTFPSPVLTAGVEVTGPVTVTLHAATSAADTDFTAKLVDVWPDGRAMSVTDGIVRARFRSGPEASEPVRPGDCHEYRIDLIATSQLFRAGHRIRVDVASSNFPCYDRNPGNGAGAGQASERDFVTAEQTVFHDAARPSHITLPVIPG